MKLCIVTNIPVPYRIPIYELINEIYGKNFLVIYCAKSESNRKWTLDNFRFNHIFLKNNVKAKKDGFNYVHNNLDVIGELIKFNPDVVITTGFNPTHLYAWFYSLVFSKKHIPMTDGWLYSEKDLSIVHRLIRKVVFKTSQAFIGASKNSFDLFKSYGIKEEKIFQSHLCIDNDKFKNEKKFDDREYHLMFSGQFTDRKIPFFFCEIVIELSKKIKDLKVLILGSGPLEKEIFEKLDNSKINYIYPGFVSQNELPNYYSSSKLFLFTTKLDAWGVVANEAMASGTPIISTPYAGIVNDLLIDSENGYIIDIDVNKWTEKIEKILQSPQLWETLSHNSVNIVNGFNFKFAVDGIINSSKFGYKG